MSMNLTLIRVIVILSERIIYHIEEGCKCDNLYEQQEHQVAVAELNKVRGKVFELATEDYKTDERG